MRIPATLRLRSLRRADGRVELGEVFLEYGQTRLKPTLDLCQEVAERKLFKSFRQTHQNAHDDVAPFHATLGLAGPSRLAGHRLRAGLAFAPIVRRLHFWMGKQRLHEPRVLPVACRPLQGLRLYSTKKWP